MDHHSMHLTSGDFNHDGFLDLAMSHWDQGQVSILLGNGDGSFKSEKRFAVGRGALSILAADLNGDGVDDIATGNEISDDITVLLADPHR